MRQHTITQTHKTKAGKRVGRGISAGGGKTAGRGTKGQKSRTGANSNIPRTFDGGATSFIERLPKLKGFKSHVKKPLTINIVRLVPHFEDKEQVSFTSLIEKGLATLKNTKQGIKIVSSSKPTNKKFSFDLSDTRLTISQSLK